MAFNPYGSFLVQLPEELPAPVLDDLVRQDAGRLVPTNGVTGHGPSPGMAGGSVPRYRTPSLSGNLLRLHDWNEAEFVHWLETGQQPTRMYLCRAILR